jgi:membrane protein DedA with SNARE-associated domain
VRVADLVHTYGNVAVAGLITLEGMGLPLPGEIALITAAAFAAHGDFGIAGVAGAAWIGTIAGGTGGYWMGRSGGIAFVRRYGRWAGLTAEREIVARAFFAKHGVRTILVARFVAILRMIAGILAGSAEMPFGLFFVCNAIGGLVWSVAFATLGYLFGRHLPQLEGDLKEGSFGLLLVIVLIGVIVWLYRRRQREKAPPAA